MHRAFYPIAFLAAFAWTNLCQAQMEPANTVSGTGTATVSRMPETMRLQVSVMGRGATLKDALATLKERTTKAQTQLVALGAEKSSIKIADPRITELPGSGNQRMQMQMMMMQRMKRGGKPQKATATPPVLVTSQLTAEWKLASKGSDELLLAVHPIQEKIKAADIAGLKDAEKLSPEQEEMLEESEQDFSFNSSDEQKPGEPVFLFVSVIPQAERDKAMAEAFGKARLSAQRLAKAAGQDLGPLKSLSNSGAMGIDYEDYSAYAYNSPAMRALQMARRQSGASSSDDDAEAIGVEPGPVKYHASITASFALGGSQ